MEREDDPQLWDLLRHSKTPEPSPFFARNVLRAVRAESSSGRKNIGSWLQLRRLIPSFSALAAVVISAFTLHALHSNRTTRSVNHQIAPVEIAEADLATDLDVLTGDDDADDAPLL